MSDDRKKPLWPWIVAVLIGPPLIYVASFGPACWFSASDPAIVPQVARFYWPLTRAAWAYPGDFAIQALWRYGMLSSPRNFKAVVKILGASNPK
jgi:hypothetical protein